MITDEMIVEIADMEKQGICIQDAARQVTAEHGLGEKAAGVIAREYEELGGMVESCFCRIGCFC